MRKDDVDRLIELRQANKVINNVQSVTPEVTPDADDMTQEREMAKREHKPVVSQNKWILKTMRSKPLTALEALQGCGCMRLASRINDLRADGHIIVTEMVKKNGKKFAKYFLIKENT